MRPGRGIGARASGSGGPTGQVTPPAQPPAQPAPVAASSANQLQLPVTPPAQPPAQPPAPIPADIEQLLAFLPSDGIYGVAALRSMIEQRLAAQAAAVEPLAEAVLPPTPAEPAQPQHVCGMCYELLADKAHEALVPCGHTFHSSCIEKWMKSYRLPRTRCCIYKCFRTQLLVVDGVNEDEPTGFDALASSSADGQQPPPAPPPLVSQAITAIIGAFPAVEEVPPTPMVAADEPASQPLLDALQQALDSEVTAAGPNPRDID